MRCSSLGPPRWRAVLAAVVAIAVATPAVARAQGTVTGVLALEERPDAEHGDVRGAVVYLVPRTPLPAVAPRDASAPPMNASIAMRGREFVPHVRVVAAGGSVAFPNQDPFSHNVFSNVEYGAFDLGLYRRGTARSASFTRAGIYPIYCNIHSQMVSFVVAVPTPWAAQPESDGRFTIRGVPAGRYVLHAWHERGAAEVIREVDIGPNGAGPLPVVIDARPYAGTQHLNKFGRPYAVIRDDRY